MFDVKTIPREALAEVCRRYQVRKLDLFGSALGPDFAADSDLDLLVTFAPQARIGFLALARLARELSGLLGRKVDLVPKDGLKPTLRDEVLSHLEVLFAA
jgi:predicted nucleotidyltransferase